MPNPRQAAIQAIATTEHELNQIDFQTAHLKDLFGVNVFNEEVQKARLPKPVFKALQKTIKHGRSSLDPAVADAVASAMKDWAIEKGATHYTHLFQPMTGLTAEKHDSFLHARPATAARSPSSAARNWSRASRTPSRFPSGGIRATFEARGYTAWDPTSPAYILENPERRHAGHPDRVLSAGPARRSTRRPRCSRSMEALSHAGDAHPEAVRQQRRARRSSPPSARSRNTS